MKRMNLNTLVFKIALPLIAAVNIAVLSLILFSDELKSTKAIVIAVTGLVAAAALTVLAFILEKRLRAKLGGEELFVLNNVTLEFIQNLKQPLIIADDEGNTLWYNDMMSKMLEGSKFIEYGENISSVTDGVVTLADLLRGESVSAVIRGVRYTVTPYSVQVDEKTNVVAVFEDMTDLDALSTELKMKNPVVSFVVVDNTGELYANMLDKNREASNKVAEILQRCAEELHALIKEYERDRYILVYERRYLLELIDKKFDILDEIREATTGESNVPVTVSIGTACDEKEFSDKVNSAKQALEHALQRGGDQSVVKFAQSVEIYGGRSKTVQKRSKLRSRVIVSELEQLIKNSSNVLIMGHKFADHDAIGASLGIARISMHCGKKANIVCDLNDANYKSIIKDVYEKPDYKDYFIDNDTALELLEADTLVVAVDVNNVQLMQEPQLFLNALKTAVIDHHRKSEEFVSAPKIAYIEPSVSSTCELISEMLEQFLQSGELLKEEADILLSGIWLDTNQFSKNTGVRTFGAAQYLRGEGASPVQTAALFKQSATEVMGEAKFESNITVYLDHIAVSAVNEECDVSDKISAAKAADKLINIKNILASFVLYKTGGVINISARSTGSINVALILEKMGGGGHFDMAGAQIKSSDMNNVLRMLKDKIDEYMKSEQ